jgi:hypothetical protein
MDELLVTLGIAITLGLTLALTIYFVLARARKSRRRREVAGRFSVAELLAKATNDKGKSGQ